MCQAHTKKSGWVFFRYIAKGDQTRHSEGTKKLAIDAVVKCAEVTPLARLAQGPLLIAQREVQMPEVPDGEDHHRRRLGDGLLL